MNNGQPTESFEPFCKWNTYDATYENAYLEKDIGSGLFALRLDDVWVYFGRFENDLKSRIRVLRQKKDGEVSSYKVINENIKVAIHAGRKIEAFVLPMPDSTRQEWSMKLKELKKAILPLWKS